jgi:hypothetical protein
MTRKSKRHEHRAGAIARQQPGALPAHNVPAHNVPAHGMSAHDAPARHAPGLHDRSPEVPSLEVTGSVALTLIGGMLGIVFLPLVWVFIDRLLDPVRNDEMGETLVQLAIAIAFCGGAWAAAGGRHRIAMDAATHGVTWTRSLFGLPLHRVFWAHDEIEAVAVSERRTMRGHRYYTIDLVGPHGRRPLKTDSERGVEARLWADALGVACNEDQPATRSPASVTQAARPVTTLQLIGTIAAVTITFPALMWYRSGPTAIGYGLGFSGFLSLLVLALWLSDRSSADEQPVDYRKSRFDWLAVVWLLSVPFGPLLGWGATEQIDRDNWLMMAGIRVFLSVVLPLVGVLPMLRFVRGRHARVAGMVLLVGTAFPLLTAMGSTLDVVRGPVWRDVTVTAVNQRRLYRGGVSPLLEVHLADGRILRTVEGVVPRKGPARLLLLEGLDRVLDVAR